MSEPSTEPLIARQVAEGRMAYDELAPGEVAEIHTPSSVVFGRTILLASAPGSSIDAVGVVIGQRVRRKFKQHTREVFITDQLPQSQVKLRKPMSNSARACTKQERLDYTDALERAGRSRYSFVREAAEIVAEDLGPAEQTKESRCARILVECAARRGYDGETEVPVAGSQGSSRQSSRSARADAVIRLTAKDGGHRVLVVETEWAKPGGSESAAQVWEYAARLKYKGGFAEDRVDIGVESTELADALILPCVVANDIPDVSLAGDRLGVARMHYAEFLRMLRQGSFTRLTPLGGEQPPASRS